MDVNVFVDILQIQNIKQTMFIGQTQPGWILCKKVFRFQFPPKYVPGRKLSLLSSLFSILPSLLPRLPARLAWSIKDIAVQSNNQQSKHTKLKRTSTGLNCSVQSNNHKSKHTQLKRTSTGLNCSVQSNNHQSKHTKLKSTITGLNCCSQLSEMKSVSQRSPVSMIHL